MEQLQQEFFQCEKWGIHETGVDFSTLFVIDIILILKMENLII
jgi:hypothetical protein